MRFSVEDALVASVFGAGCSPVGAGVPSDRLWHPLQEHVLPLAEPVGCTTPPGAPTDSTLISSPRRPGGQGPFHRERAQRGEGSPGSHALVGGHLAAVAQAHASWAHSQEGSAPHSPGVTFLPRFGGSRAEAASLLRLD